MFVIFAGFPLNGKREVWNWHHISTVHLKLLWITHYIRKPQDKGCAAVSRRKTVVGNQPPLAVICTAQSYAIITVVKVTISESNPHRNPWIASHQRPSFTTPKSDKSSSLAFSDVSPEVDNSGLDACVFCLLECKNCSQGQSSYF